MGCVPWLALLLAALMMGGYVQGQLPFQVNSRPSCTSKVSLDTTTLTGIARGDETAPCSGNMRYTFDGNTHRLCGNADYGLSDYAAERACYTLGVNFYRDTASFNAAITRQMKLYKCVSYREQNADSVMDSRDGTIIDASAYIDVRQGTGCRDEKANPAAYDCFDTCYFTDPGYSEPSFDSEYSCEDHRSFFTLACTDINECVQGVMDHCKGPFDTSCTIRKACGNNTDCANHPGSFECSCRNGYEYRSGDPFDPYDLHKGCKDINECSQSKCSPNANCENIPGSYICRCNAGYVGNGETCTPVLCGNPPTFPNAAYQVPGTIYSLQYGDTLVYDCHSGHKVSIQNVPEALVNYYGYSGSDAFTLTCGDKGEWGPYPVPECKAVDCGDPGVVANADRVGMSFVYKQEVSYSCDKGYKPQIQTSSTSMSFTRTCQADGTWTLGTFCVDIDECEENKQDVCPEVEQNCINTRGSYFCLVGFPDTCDLQEGLTLCKNGKCEMSGGKAKCVCDSGFTGLLCDTPAFSTALIIAIVAMVLVIFHIIIHCCRSIFRQRTALLAATQNPPRRNVSPVYGLGPGLARKQPSFGFPRQPVRW